MKESEENGAQEEQELTFLEFLETIFGFKPIESPLQEVKGSAMVLAASSGRAFLGSMQEIGGEGLLEMFYPLVYLEMPHQDPTTGQVSVTSQMGKEFMLLRTPKWKLVRVDSLYFLDLEITQDKQMAQEYEKAITQIRATDSGIALAGSPSLVGGGSVPPIKM